MSQSGIALALIESGMSIALSATRIWGRVLRDDIEGALTQSCERGRSW